VALPRCISMLSGGAANGLWVRSRISTSVSRAYAGVITFHGLELNSCEQRR